MANKTKQPRFKIGQEVFRIDGGSVMKEKILGVFKWGEGENLEFRYLVWEEPQFKYDVAGSYFKFDNDNVEVEYNLYATKKELIKSIENQDFDE